jgi:serine/threonine-protein kinase
VNPGERLDRFVIERLVVRSGMASIFRAVDSSSGAIVALKVPHFELESDPLFYDRFRREAEIGKRLDHPGIVRILPVEDPSRLYMAMEWVEGRPLREILDEEKKLPLERAVRIALAVCDALGYIHSQGVVHRDLKPDNIMVDGDRIKLIDFGIAGQTGVRRLTFAKFTKAMGTPDYVAPEQVKGKRGDARTDLYTLGVILFEMLTGQLPFQGASPLIAMNQRLLADPIAARKIDPAISPQMEEILHRALERQPEHRYALAREFARDLQHPEQVGVEDRAALRASLRLNAPRPRAKWSWSYLALALIPVVLFALLLFVAHQK